MSPSPTASKTFESMGTNPNRSSTFRFKQFEIVNSLSAMKVGTDGVLLGAWADNDKTDRILDIGSGSGLISLMLAQRFPDARITGIEIDPQATAEARLNASNTAWQDRITFICNDFCEWSTDEKFDMIVSNPPFFTNGLKSPDSSRATARHAAGLSPASILDRASKMLDPDGVIAMIVPADMVDNLIFEAAMHRLNPLKITNVTTRAGKPPRRTLISFTPKSCAVVSSIFTISGADGFTPEYRDLTHEFYLEF